MVRGRRSKQKKNHNSTLYNRAKRKISSIKNHLGILTKKPNEIVDTFVNHFYEFAEVNASRVMTLCLPLFHVVFGFMLISFPCFILQMFKNWMSETIYLLILDNLNLVQNS